MKQHESDRVVVTGVGVVSPLGLNKVETWDNLIAKKSGVEQITHFDASHFSTSIAAEVKQFDENLFCDKKTLRHTTSSIKFAFSAADEALSDAGIRPQSKTAARWGLIVGSSMTMHEYRYWERFQSLFAKEGRFDAETYCKNTDFISAPDFSKSISNSALSLLLSRYGIEGYATSVHTACASGGQALGQALQVMRRGDADCVLVGGFDSMINPHCLASFILLDAVSNYNHTPTTASRPFDLTRNGFVLGEGAAFMVLERFGSASKRGAKIYAELAGEGNSLSSHRITDSHPFGDGAIQAITKALVDAGLSYEQVDCINAHGTSTKMNDFSETNAIKHVFRDRAKKIPVSATKSQTGHLIAAAGALEGVLSVLSIQHQVVPMTSNLATKDPDCDLDYVVEGPRHQNINVVLSNSFGFGGSNSSLIFKKIHE